jgi:hypothetical protein
VSTTGANRGIRIARPCRGAGDLGEMADVGFKVRADRGRSRATSIRSARCSSCHGPCPALAPLPELRAGDPFSQEIGAFLKVALAPPDERFASVSDMKRALQETMMAAPKLLYPAGLAFYLYKLLNPESTGVAPTDADSTNAVETEPRLAGSVDNAAERSRNASSSQVLEAPAGAAARDPVLRPDLRDRGSAGRQHELARSWPDAARRHRTMACTRSQGLRFSPPSRLGNPVPPPKQPTFTSRRRIRAILVPGRLQLRNGDSGRGAGTRTRPAEDLRPSIAFARHLSAVERSGRQGHRPRDPGTAVTGHNRRGCGPAAALGRRASFRCRRSRRAARRRAGLGARSTTRVQGAPRR